MHHAGKDSDHASHTSGPPARTEQKGAAPRTFSWRARSLFAPPLNATYTHRNRSADRPARLLVVNNAPLVMSLYHDEEFVFGVDYWEYQVEATIAPLAESAIFADTTKYAVRSTGAGQRPGSTVAVTGTGDRSARRTRSLSSRQACW